ncbi:MAG: cytochrome c [Terrimicrobiaceae bacterium]
MKIQGEHARDKPALQVVVALALAMLGGGCKPAKTETSAISADAGQELYDLYCATCHLDGGASFPTPALNGSAVVAGPVEETIRVILHGQSGKSQIDGEVTGGIMPAQAGLTNDEIAAIVSFVRSEFAGKEDPVLPSRVESLRIK